MSVSWCNSQVPHRKQNLSQQVRQCNGETVIKGLPPEVWAGLKEWTKDFEAPRVWHQQEAINSPRAEGEEKLVLEPGESWSSLRGAIGVERHSYQQRRSY